MMESSICIKNLKVSCILGILEHERSFRQEVLLDIEVKKDLEAFYQSKDLKDSVDYAELASRCEEKLCQGEFLFMEDALWALLQLIFQDSNIHHASLAIKKTKAIAQAEYGSLSLSISRQDYQSSIQKKGAGENLTGEDL